jgi:hypothetical protein
MGQQGDLKLVEGHDEGVQFHRLDRIKILEDLTYHVPQQKGLGQEHSTHVQCHAVLAMRISSALEEANMRLSHFASSETRLEIVPATLTSFSGG